MERNLESQSIPPEIAGTKADPRRTSKGNSLYGPTVRTPRCTKAEMRNRIAATVQLIANRVPEHQIIRALKDKYGYGRRHATRLVSRARKQMRRRSRMPPIDLAAEAREFYEKIIRDPDADMRHKLEAQAALRQMLGLDKPSKLALTDPSGEKSWRLDPEKLSDEELAVLVQVEERMQGLATGKEGDGVN